MNCLYSDKANYITGKLVKLHILDLIDKARVHKADSFQDVKQKHAFNETVKTLITYFDKYTPPGLKEKNEQEYRILNKKIERIKHSDLTVMKQELEIVTCEFVFFKKIYHQLLIMLPRTPVLEESVIGTLDVTDEQVSKIIRGEINIEFPAMFGN